MVSLVVGSACGARAALFIGADSGSGGAVAVTTGGGHPEPTGSSVGAGGSSCVPAMEICNGVDDDCNGAIDETDPHAGEACDTGQAGVCAAGVRTCVSGQLTCVPAIGPTPEVCNGIDDDCNGVADDGIACTRRVFVSSAVFNGDLGGLAGGDAKCQALADAAGLGGTFRAWLSASTISAADRLAHSGAPYVLVDGVTVVAADWVHLVNSHVEPLLHPIDATETMGPPPVVDPQLGHRVYTGTIWDGSTYDTGCPLKKDCATCDNWTSVAGTSVWGDATVSDNGWTYAAGTGPLGTCGLLAALYCFEQ